jgi:hypothetical protein
MDGFDPYYEWLGIPPKDQPANAYRLLGLELFESNPKAIETAAEQRMLLLRTRQSGKHGPDSQRLLNEISQTQRLLLDPVKRAAYDDQLRTQLAALVEPRPQAQPSGISPSIPLSATLLSSSATDVFVSPLPIGKPSPNARRKGAPSVLLSLAGGAGLLLIAGVVALIATMIKEAPSSNPPSVAVPRPEKIAKQEPAVHKATGGDQVSESTEKVEQASRPKNDAPPILAGQTSLADRGPLPGTEANPSPPLAEPAALDIPSRQPLPTEEETQAALSTLRKTLASDFQSFADASDRSSFLQRLDQLAEESVDRPADHVALLMETRRLAMEIGDWWLAARMVDRLDQRYETDRYGLLAESFVQSAQAKIDRPERLLLFRRLIEFTSDLIEAHELTRAAKLLKDVERPLKALDDPLVSEAADELRARGAELYPFYKLAKESLAKLREEHDDQEANLLTGEYVCLACGKWPDGLLLLSHGSNEVLRELAQRDLSRPSQAADQFALASAWWEYAQSLADLQKRNTELRAAQWYRTALAGLQGDDLKLAEQRVDDLLPLGLVALASPLDELPSAMPETLYLDDVADDFAAIAGGIAGRHGATGMRGDIAFPSWSWKGQRVEHALFFHPVSHGKSFMLFRLGGAYRRFRGTVGIVEAPGANPPASRAIFRILGDGRLLWQSRPRQERGGEGESYDIDISQVNTLRIETSSPGRFDNVHAAWIQPQLYRPVKPLKTYSQRAQRTSNEVYLDDLLEAESLVGHARLARMGSTTNAINEIAVLVSEHEQRALRSITMVPQHNGSAHAVYHVDRQFTEFRARVGVIQETNLNQEVSPLTFRVIGDGKVLWKSNEITRANHFESCSVRIAGVRQLRIQVDCGGTHHGAWATWLDAQLTPMKDAPNKTRAATPNPHDIRADRVVLWNVHNGHHRDHGTRRINLLLFRGNRLVWQKTGVDIPWDGVSDKNVSVSIPQIAFNRVRAEITDIAGDTGSGLAEIEVFRGTENLARTAVATACPTWLEQSTVENFGASMINDGITTSDQFGFGYALLERRTNGWFELEWQPADGKAHPTLKYPLKRRPAMAVSFNGHWYLFMPGGLAWAEAQQRCQDMGGYLACIESPEENEFLHELAKRHHAWIGLTRQSDNAWAWIDGSKLRYRNWTPGEPNNTSAGESAGEIIASGGWNDASLSRPENQGFLCEWDN